MKRPLAARLFLSPGKPHGVLRVARRLLEDRAAAAKTFAAATIARIPDESLE